MWSDLHSEVLGEFIEAQGPSVDRIRSMWMRAHSEYVLRKKLAKKAWSLRAMRKRLCKRAVIECGNAKCRVAFVPYRSDTLYCSRLCRLRETGLRAYYRRRVPLPTRTCARCGAAFAERRRHAMYCSGRCRHLAAGAAYRARRAAA